MGLDAVAAEVRQGVAAMGEGVGAMTGQPWRMTPSMLAMGRRRAEVEAVAAAATVVGVVVEAVDLARDKMGDPPGGNMTDRMAQAAGERTVLELQPCISCCLPPHLRIALILQAIMADPRCCRSETEKRHGAGRGNWGAEGDEIKE